VLLPRVWAEAKRMEISVRHQFRQAINIFFAEWADKDVMFRELGTQL